MDTEIFLIDTNTLITPYKNYYPFDLVPSFWIKLKSCIEDGTVVILDMVSEEVLKGNDSLTDWLRSIDAKNFISHISPSIITNYGNVLESIQNNPCYLEAALKEWSKVSVADPWLIATAIEHNFTIITFEQPNRNLNAKNPTRKAKIPDIAATFNVRSESLFYMMRKLNFKF